MAGIIEFRSGDWNVSSGGFRAMAIGVLPFLSSGTSGTFVKEALTLAIESQLYFLDVAEGFTAEMNDEFQNALCQYIDSLKSSDGHCSDAPELHQGYLCRLFDLQEKLASSTRGGRG